MAICWRIANDLKLSVEILSVPVRNSARTLYEFNAAWSRTYLKKINAIGNSMHGVWSITDAGKKIPTEDEVNDLVIKALEDEGASKKSSKKITINIKGAKNISSEVYSEVIVNNWKDGLLGILRDIDPKAFERLCQRVLLESGFTKVSVTSYSKDGGIDGYGELRVGLISFRVCFQCKRYIGPVSAPEIQAFKRAMEGQTDKGIVITTGRFTSDARNEARRKGTKTIDLIDGNELCELLRRLELGVETVEVGVPNPEFFSNI